MSSQSESFYVPAYDGLRFVLLLGVLEYHYLILRVPIERFWFLTYSLCCFFVLSGFLITHLLLRSQQKMELRRVFTTFYSRRALRVLPAYYFVLVLAGLVLTVPYWGWHAGYLFNCKVFAISAFDRPAFDVYIAQWETNGVHLWSMCVEEQFYLLYPPLLLFCPRRWRPALLSLGIALCIAVRLWLAKVHPFSFYGALLPVAGEYVLWGCLLALLDLEGKLDWLRSRWALYGSLVGLGLTFWWESTQELQRYIAAQMQPPTHQTVYAVLLAVFLLGLKHNRDSWLNRLLGATPLASLGKISYGAYSGSPIPEPRRRQSVGMAALSGAHPAGPTHGGRTDLVAGGSGPDVDNF